MRQPVDQVGVLLAVVLEPRQRFSYDAIDVL
jgi:hypothetical protein